MCQQTLCEKVKENEKIPNQNDETQEWFGAGH